MKIDVRNTLDDLARDTRTVTVGARRDMVKVVRRNVHAGMIQARANARRTAGTHGKHYPRSITEEMTLFGALGLIAGEYGPDPAMQQGGMSFEGGSRNQPAHNDLLKSSLVAGRNFIHDVDETVGDWFWPGAR